MARKKKKMANIAKFNKKENTNIALKMVSKNEKPKNQLHSRVVS